MTASFTIPFAALVVACSAPATEVKVANSAATAEPAPRPYEGDHRAPHTIGVVCDQGSGGGWCEEQVEDHISIHGARDGAIAVAIRLVQTNAHSCTFDGELAPAPAPQPDVRRWTFTHETDDGPCALQLDVTKHAIELSANGCRYYCGMRASLDAKFPL